MRAAARASNPHVEVRTRALRSAYPHGDEEGNPCWKKATLEDVYCAGAVRVLVCPWKMWISQGGEFGSSLPAVAVRIHGQGTNLVTSRLRALHFLLEVRVDCRPFNYNPMRIVVPGGPSRHPPEKKGNNIEISTPTRMKRRKLLLPNDGTDTSILGMLETNFCRTTQGARNPARAAKRERRGGLTPLFPRATTLCSGPTARRRRRSRGP